MGAKVTGLEQLTANIQRLSKQTVPKSVAKSINKVARKAMKNGTKTVSKQVNAPVKLIRKRVQLKQKATSRIPVAKISVNRSNLPLIRLLEDPRRKVIARQGQIKIGKHRIQRGFIQTLKNGRTHVMQRQGKARYPIDVVKIPLSGPLTQAFHDELKDYQEQVKVELVKELSRVFHK
ncbi:MULTISPECIES: phage tail protein [Rodentibacter]|uniref:phage tail protein n=1 Tax=Rodentibacter TaxID=1960084 RepID=UPI00098964B0|nr:MULTISPECIES: phage tail protein [Pasteurellaceae]MCQ9122900.1 phage tail protein [Rodentibacter heylii]MCR1838448.1 phage tail protein [Pasteurella caecimuris]MCU0107740.1 phage tail protein [Pasteurella caecimuris]OOF64661.1 phage tail protein [Rodentibacter pneumotropicus]TGY51021.1 phage tail protein [Pasteurella caecimuris]